MIYKSRFIGLWISRLGSPRCRPHFVRPHCLRHNMAEAIEQWTRVSEKEWLIVLTRPFPSRPCLSSTGSEPHDLTTPYRAYLSIEVQREFSKACILGTHSNHSKVQLFGVCWSRCLLFSKCCVLSPFPPLPAVSVSCLSFMSPHVPLELPCIWAAMLLLTFHCWHFTKLCTYSFGCQSKADRKPSTLQPCKYF